MTIETDGERILRENKEHERRTRKDQLKVQLKKLSAKAVVPEYKSVGAAGFDLVSTQDVTIEHEYCISSGCEY